jgi:hypothetical protein
MKYGYQGREPMCHALPESEFRHNFNDPSWDIDRRIVNIASEGSRVERSRLPVLLELIGWKILTRERKKKDETLYVPSWNASVIDWDTMISFTLNIDFFIEAEEVEKHLKVRSRQLDQILSIDKLTILPSIALRQYTSCTYTIFTNECD